MPILLFDNARRRSLYPLTLTRSVAEMRSGIFSVQERWEFLSGMKTGIHTAKWLQPLYEKVPEGEYTWVDASLVPDDVLIDRILSLDAGHCIADETGLIAGRAAIPFADFDPALSLQFFSNIQDYPSARRWEHPWQFMQWNDEMIRKDFAWIRKSRQSQRIPATVQVMGPEDIFIGEGAKLQFCTLNASTGPIYLGKNSEVMEGSSIRGPFVLGENSLLKMNSRIYGATTLGPNCMGGGEIKNTVMMANSNKAHDGYLGDSVVGQWCNFGAGSTSSNVKNTAGEVKVWDMGAGDYANVGVKCGLIMGDYSRAAINSSLNTGTMIGVSANIFGQGLLPTLIDHFSWGVDVTRYELEKAITAADNWKKLKGQTLSAAEAAVLKHIFANKT